MLAFITHAKVELITLVGQGAEPRLLRWVKTKSPGFDNIVSSRGHTLDLVTAKRHGYLQKIWLEKKIRD